MRKGIRKASLTAALGLSLIAATCASWAMADNGAAVSSEVTAPTQVRVEATAGDTLDAMLARAGVSAAGPRAEIVLGLRAEFDPKDLRPGQVLVLTRADAPAGEIRRVILEIGDGVRIELDLSGRWKPRRVEPETIAREVAREAVIETSVVADLETAGVPARVAFELVEALAGIMDFRREIRGGERVALLLEEKTLLTGDVVAPPELRYAHLEIGGRVLEVARASGRSEGTRIFEDGKSVRVIAPPVANARVSSVFGRRRHPVYGTVKMHSGVDFAARRGAPVSASAPGVVGFAGWRGGYGRVVEIRHGSGLTTRYAHLQKIAGDVTPGVRLAAGDRLGQVGSSGTATGANLHFEVRLDGRPVDPLENDRLVQMAQQAEIPGPEILRPLRQRIADLLKGGSPA